MIRLSDQCRAAAAKCRHFPEGAALLRAWARQQQLSQGADGLNSTVLTMMLVHLVEMGQVVSRACLGSFGVRLCLLLTRWLLVCGCAAADALAAGGPA